VQISTANVQMLLVDAALLKSVATEVVFFSVVTFNFTFNAYII